MLCVVFVCYCRLIASFPVLSVENSRYSGRNKLRKYRCDSSRSLLKHWSPSIFSIVYSIYINNRFVFRSAIAILIRQFLILEKRRQADPLLWFPLGRRKQHKSLYFFNHSDFHLVHWQVFCPLFARLLRQTVKFAAKTSLTCNTETRRQKCCLSHRSSAE